MANNSPQIGKHISHTLAEPKLNSKTYKQTVTLKDTFLIRISDIYRLLTKHGRKLTYTHVKLSNRNTILSVEARQTLLTVDTSGIILKTHLNALNLPMCTCTILTFIKYPVIHVSSF